MGYVSNEMLLGIWVCLKILDLLPIHGKLDGEK